MPRVQAIVERKVGSVGKVGNSYQVHFFTEEDMASSKYDCLLSGINPIFHLSFPFHSFLKILFQN